MVRAARSKELGFAHEAFDAEAASYERGRPGYPAEAVAWILAHLDKPADSTIVDVAAGTGKLTRLLANGSSLTVAVEPVAGMVAQLVGAVPLTHAVMGAAEALPLVDERADAITVAQAFHWFRTDVAFPELHRILRPGGGIGLIWNDADTSVDWVAKLSDLSPRRPGELLRRLRKVLSARSRDVEGSAWAPRCREAFATTDLFGPIEHAQFRHDEEMEVEAVVDWVRSFSRFARLTNDEQSDVVQQAYRLMAKLPSPISLPYRTDVFWSWRLGQ